MYACDYCDSVGAYTRIVGNHCYAFNSLLREIMMRYTFSDYKRELKLTIANTYLLHKQALRVTSFSWQSDDIEKLYMATWAKINKDSGENVAPALITDKDVREVKQAVAAAAWALQIEDGEGK